jgi:hypothetical protein
LKAKKEQLKLQDKGKRACPPTDEEINIKIISFILSDCKFTNSENENIY